MNIRLAPEQISYIANHARDRAVIVDHTLFDAFSAILPDLTTIEHIIVNGPTGDTKPGDGRVAIHDYSSLLDGQPTRYDWPSIDETAAAMCYTSGTTG